MEIALGIFIGLCVLEGVALGLTLSPWGQKKVVRKFIKLAKYGQEEAKEIVAELREALRD